MTKKLTDKWRAGNLKKSFYYLKFPDTETAEIYNLYDMEKFRYVQDSDKIDVLDEVPNYDEYKRLVRKSDKLDKIMSDTVTNQGDCQQIVEDNLNRQIKRLQEKLEIATKALKEIKEHTKELSLPSYTGMLCHKALKEMEGVK